MHGPLDVNFVNVKQAEEKYQYKEFYCKNKFEKLVHLDGFIIRIYHDARSTECQKRGLLRYVSYCSSLPLAYV